MGLLDELKKLTKPYDDEDYLEENFDQSVRAGGRPPDNRSYASYAEPPRAETNQAPRRPYVFSRPAQAQQQQQYAQPGYDVYAQGGYQQGYDQPPYQQTSYQQAQYAQQGYQQPYDQQPPYQSPYQQPQTRLLLVRPDRFEVAADIADRIREHNAIVLNLEATEKTTTRRILDFLSGVTYALGGTVKRVSGNTFIITPAGVDFTGDGYGEPTSGGSYV